MNLLTCFVGRYSVLARQYVEAELGDRCVGNILTLRENQGIETTQGELFRHGFGAYPNQWKENGVWRPSPLKHADLTEESAQMHLVRVAVQLEQLRTILRTGEFKLAMLDYEGGHNDQAPSLAARIRSGRKDFVDLCRTTLDMCRLVLPPWRIGMYDLRQIAGLESTLIDTPSTDLVDFPCCYPYTTDEKALEEDLRKRVIHGQGRGCPLFWDKMDMLWMNSPRHGEPAPDNLLAACVRAVKHNAAGTTIKQFGLWGEVTTIQEAERLRGSAAKIAELWDKE